MLSPNRYELSFLEIDRSFWVCLHWARSKDTPWHGMYEVAERFYMEMIPQARAIAEHAATQGQEEAAEAILGLIDQILSRPEHAWFKKAKKEKEASQSDAAAKAANSAGTDEASTA